jgi:hypothetical protein
MLPVIDGHLADHGLAYSESRRTSRQRLEVGPDLRAGRSNKADSSGKGAILDGQLGDLPLLRLYTDRSKVPCPSHRARASCDR